MEFWASCEVYKPATTTLERARHCVEPFLNAAFSRSSLSKLDCEIRYVPIVMPEEYHDRYPARSKLRKKQKLYDCAPILDYEVFVNGTLEDQLREYLRGIAESAPYLADLGASPEQIQEFEDILAGAVDKILLERPDQTRH